METKNKCFIFDGRHKKVLIVAGLFVIFAIAIIAIGSVSWKMNQARNYAWSNETDRGQMMNKNKVINSVPVNVRDDQQFTLPEDAAKSGEIAFTIADLESAKKAVAEVAAKNGGNVYATYISYASSVSKNGSMVVQVPIGNFDLAFGSLKNIGSRIIQEKTSQIPVRNIYPVGIATPMTTVNKVDNGDAVKNQEPSVTSAMMPAYYPQTIQNKGYIRVIFADYGQNKVGSIMNRDENFNASDQRLWIAVILKGILVIVLFVILILMLRKIFQNLRAGRKVKPTVHVVKQSSRASQRIVKIQRKK
jgi:hypothetical protein